jgi:CRISPR-associated protein Cas5d
MGVKIKIWGEGACFTRPEMKVERVSYDVITPSAARGVLEAIYWKPQIRWVVDRITVLRPIKFTSLRRNEVGSRASAATAKSAMKKAAAGLPADALGITVEDDRQQRAATLLRDVAYVIDAHFEYIDPAGNPLDLGDASGGFENSENSGNSGGNDAKHLDQFNRRARKGQCFHRPYLGCREFPADFTLASELPPEELRPHADLIDGRNRDLGYMLYDIDYAHGHEAKFFRATMRDGVIDVANLVRQQGVVG